MLDFMNNPMIFSIEKEKAIKSTDVNLYFI